MITYPDLGAEPVKAYLPDFSSDWTDEIAHAANVIYAMNHYYQNLHFEEKQFKTSAIFENDFLNLTVFENETAWNNNISKEDIRKQSKDFNLNEYYDNLRRYLRSCPQDVEFNFGHGTLTINLILKNKMKILFFSSTLKQVNFVENIFSLADNLYSDKIQYFEQLNKLEKQCEYLQKDNENFKEKMDIFLERRKTEEQKQYSRFVAILNEKKQHIQHLNNLIIAFRKGRPTVNSSVNKGKNTSLATKKKMAIKNVTKNTKVVTESDHSSSSSSSTLSDNNYNTDEELENNTPASNIPLISTINLQEPTTSNYKFNFMEDSPTTVFPVSRQIRIDNKLDLDIHLTKKIKTESDNMDAKTNGDSDKANTNLSPTVTFSTQDLLDNL